MLGFIFISMAIIGLLVQQASIKVWTISYFMMGLLVLHFYPVSDSIKIVGGLLLLLLILLSIKSLRMRFLTHFIFQIFRQNVPKMSATEREALEAGTVSWEGEIFSGAPNLEQLLSLPTSSLSDDERAFIQGPVQTLCQLIDDWEITHNLTDLPAEVWQFIKENRFFGMIIPKAYGGLEFSATAQAAIFATVYGRSISVATTISVPNSLGPAELLLKYGTSEQKNYYLPRLADGREIPCFALTGPTAGSDAASIPDTGIVCQQDSVLGVRLNWDKRYITLCPVATVIGLAFRLFDPENLLNRGHDIGITCALIPADTAGVTHGRRHFPLNTAFLNGPTQGKDVFIPMDYLIGGAPKAGSGWRMLMECLSAGRAISLPSSSMGGTQAAALSSGAYARVRKQFNQPIGKFEGIEEPLARIAANTYLIDAGLNLAAAAIDNGAKPAVAGAILKYHTTERARQVVCDAMDIHGGKGICLGPNNYLGRGYENAPISITVEGANILTRCLIIFGQGAIRCHPFIYNELESVRENNLARFDTEFWSHTGFILANTFKSIGYSLTDAWFKSTPKSLVKRYYQHLSRYSNHLAFLADFCMITLGDKLKRKEKISARLGDMLSTLYLVSAVLKRFHTDREPIEDKPIVDWACQQLFFECEQAMDGIINNLASPIQKFILTLILNPLGTRRLKPSDRLGQQVAQLLLAPNAARTRLTRFVYTEPLENCPIGRLEAAFNIICTAEPLEKIIAKAVKDKLISGLTLAEQLQAALTKNIITQEEFAQLNEVDEARKQVVAVDDFDHKGLSRVADSKN